MLTEKRIVDSLKQFEQVPFKTIRDFENYLSSLQEDMQEQLDFIQGNKPFVIHIYMGGYHDEPLSYEGVLGAMEQNEPEIHTYCLDFFSAQYADDYEVIVHDGEGCIIVMSEVLANQGNYTMKEIRKSHNLRKMLVAGSLTFKSRY